MSSKKILFTCGDINGIGPEIALKTFNAILNKKNKFHLIFICPLNVFKYYYDNYQLKFPFKIINNIDQTQLNLLNLIPIPNTKIKVGKPTIHSGKSAYDSLLLAIDYLKRKKSYVVLTSPVSKYAINLAGINFKGQTELFANQFAVTDFLMMFISPKIKAALHTIHIPLKNVAANIQKNSLVSKLKLLVKTLKFDFAINNPSIAVLGLNPHAGENGYIGDEEKKIISKALTHSKHFKGPFVPDAFFANHFYKNFDAVYGMYHDQILIPFKMISFNNGVNFTAGLPIIRTSPDHGAAFDIAGNNCANHSSMLSAFKSAIEIMNNRIKNER